MPIIVKMPNIGRSTTNGGLKFGESIKLRYTADLLGAAMHLCSHYLPLSQGNYISLHYHKLSTTQYPYTLEMLEFLKLTDYVSKLLQIHC